MRLIFRTMIAGLSLAACIGASNSVPQTVATAEEGPITSRLEGPYARSFAYVVIGVADMEKALDLWVDSLGMEVADRRRGGDPGLTRVWGLGAEAIVDQALLNHPGLLDGGVHLVQFARPRPPVRQEAASFDLGLHSVHVAVRDIRARYRELEEAGLRPRSEVERLEQGNTAAHAARMLAHDAVDVVLFEHPRAALPTSRARYAVMPHVMAVVGDLEAEQAFFTRAIGLQQLEQYRLTGTAAEEILGAPRGGTVAVRILGGPESHFGRIALARYEGASGEDLRGSARPPALGLLSLTYVVPDLAPLRERGKAFRLRDHGKVRSVLGEGDMATLHSPGGLRIDFIAQ